MKKTRVNFNSENSLFIRNDMGTCVYKVIYDSLVLVEPARGEQESSVMIFYHGKNLLLKSVVDDETIEEKFSSALNLRPINIFLEEIMDITSL